MARAAVDARGRRHGSETASGSGSSVFEQLPFADFLHRGELDRHLRRTRPIYRSRRDALVTALRQSFQNLRIQGIAAGLHFMIELSADWDEQAVVAAAARRSVRAVRRKRLSRQPGFRATCVARGLRWYRRIRDARRGQAPLTGRR